MKGMIVKPSYSVLGLLAAGSAYFALFILLQHSPYADIFRIRLIFRDAIIPIYQFGLTLAFVVTLRYAFGQNWKKACAYGVIIGLLLDMYPAMLDSQAQVWSGARLSGAYVIYINIFVLAVSLLLVCWGAYIVSSIFNYSSNRKRAEDIAPFFPAALMSAYGAAFYCLSGRTGPAILLAGAFVISLAAMSRRDAILRLGDLFGRIVKWMAREDRLLVLIFIVAFAARVVFLINLLSIEGARFPLASDDGDAYDAWGVKGTIDPSSFFRESPHQWMLFYSVFLSVVYKIFGHSFLAAGVVQSLIGALLCCAVFILAKRVTGSIAVAALASLGTASDTALIHLTVTFNTEALYIPLIVLTVLFLLFYRESKVDAKGVSFILLAGVSLGLATIIRVLGIMLIIFVLPWIAVYGRPYLNRLFMNRIRDCAVFAAFTFMMIAPITLVNYINTGQLVLVYKTGSALWACGSAAWGEEVVPSNKKLIELGMKDPVADPAGSVKAFLARPKDLLKAYGQIVPKRLRNLYLWPKFGAFDPVTLMNGSQVPNRYASKFEFYGILALLAGFLVFIFSDIKAYLKTLTLLVVMFYTFFHGVLFLSIGPRYGAPMKPFLYIVVSYCLYCMILSVSRSLADRRGY